MATKTYVEKSTPNVPYIGDHGVKTTTSMSWTYQYLLALFFPTYEACIINFIFDSDIGADWKVNNPSYKCKLTVKYMKLDDNTGIPVQGATVITATATNLKDFLNKTTDSLQLSNGDSFNKPVHEDDGNALKIERVNRYTGNAFHLYGWWHGDPQIDYLSRNFGMTFEWEQNLTETQTDRYGYYIGGTNLIKAYRYQKTSLSAASLLYDKDTKKSETQPSYVRVATGEKKESLSGSRVFTSSTRESFRYEFTSSYATAKQAVDSELIDIIQIKNVTITPGFLTISVKPIIVSDFLNRVVFDVDYTDNKRFAGFDVDSGVVATKTLYVNGRAYTGGELLVLPEHIGNVEVGVVAMRGDQVVFSERVPVPVGYEGEFPVRMALSGQASEFNYGDEFNFGNSAVLKVWNKDNVLIETLRGHEQIRNYCNKFLIKPYYKNSEMVSLTPVSITGNGPQTIQMKLGVTEMFKFDIYITYPEKGMMQVTRQNKTWQVDEDGLNIRSISEVQKVELVYWKNTRSDTIKVLVDVTNREKLIWSKENVSLSEAATSDVARVRFSYDAGTLEEEQNDRIPQNNLTTNVEHQIEINLFANIPVRIEATVDELGEHKTYYRYKTKFVEFSNNKEFAVPTNVTYNVVFRDGTSKPIDAQDVYFKNTQYDTEEIVEGSILKDGIWTVAACYEHPELHIVLYGQVELDIADDYVMSLDITGKNNFVLGNRYSQDQFVVTAHIGNGQEHATIDFTDYSFQKTDRVLDIPETITLLADGMIFNVSTAHISYIYPTFKSATTIRNDTKSAFINTETKVDLSTAQIMVEYVDTDYIELSDFNAENVISCAAVRISTGATLSIESLTGEHPFSESMGSGDLIWSDCAFNITFKSHLMSEARTINHVLPFYLIKEDQEITSLSVMQVTTEYYVGDEFLNENDTTLVHFTTNEGQFNVPLKSDCPLISVNPDRGHLFTTTSASTNVTITYVKDAKIQTQYSIRVSAKGYASNSETLTLAVVHIKSFPNEERYKFVPSSTIGYLALVDINDTVVLNNERVLNVDNPYFYGYINNFFNKNYNARVVLFDDYAPESNGESNITVKFPCYREGQADYINKCHFGILFGANNAENRLFLSGNKDIPNADFHSAELNMNNTDGEISAINGDFSYFSWESIMYYGETDNAVVGYDIVSNDKLLVLKSKSDKEKTVYFRTPTTVQAVDAAGSALYDVNGNAIGQEEYALIKGNNSNAGISPKSIVNFNGDTVFIDDSKQLVGLDLTGIIGDSQRYANTRSLYIDRKLKEFDLKDSILYTNKNYLFLTVKDLGIFVTHYTTKGSETNQYEWWLLSSKNPSCFIEIDGKIYFGNEDGEFYIFDNGTYKDITKIFADGAACIYDYDDEYCYISAEVLAKLDPEKTYHFKTLDNPIYYRLARISNNAEGDFEPTDLLVNNDENRLELLTDVLLPTEQDYYLNHIEGMKNIDCDSDTFKNFGDIYRLKVLDDPKHFTLQKLVNGVYVDTNVNELNNAVLCRKVTNAEIVNIDIENSRFQLNTDDGLVADIVQYGSNQSRSFNGEILLYENVEAYYITAPFTMGNLSYLKTLWSFTLTNDTKIPSELEIAYASNKIPYVDTKTLASISKESLGTDMNNLSFAKLDLDKNLVPRTYTSHRPLAKQTFTCFCFRNTNDTNSVLCALSIVYSIPYAKYGKD